MLFVPSVERDGKTPIEQDKWVTAALEMFGEVFGGATAYPKARGVWRDDERGGQLIFDAPVIVQCYTAEHLLEEKATEFRHFLLRLGTESRQGAVGFVIDRDYLEIRFPLEEQ